MRVWPGRPYPLGATWDGSGVNFAVFSEFANKVELCLFDSADSAVESRRIALPEQTDIVWHGYLPDVEPGQIVGRTAHLQPAHIFASPDIIGSILPVTVESLDRYSLIGKLAGLPEGARAQISQPAKASLPAMTVGA